MVDGDDLNEPISDAVRNIRWSYCFIKFSEQKSLPTIDVLSSISRLMNDISPEQKELSGRVKNLLSVYREAEDLINIGAYVEGNNSKIDESIKYIDKIENFLKQDVEEKIDYDETIKRLKGIFEVEE